MKSLLLSLSSLLVFAITFVESGVQIISEQDDKKLIKVLESSLAAEKSMEDIHYSLLGLTVFGSSKPKINCDKYSIKPDSKLEEIYNIISALQVMNCKLNDIKLPRDFLGMFTSCQNPKELFYYVAVSKYLNMNVDSQKIVDMVKKYTIQSKSSSWMAYCIQTLNLLKIDAKFKAQFETEFKTILDKKQEIDFIAFFDSGIFNTALLVEGVMKTYPKLISESSLIKFANFFAYRKNIADDSKSVVKSRIVLKEILKTLNKPLVITVPSDTPLSLTDKSPSLSVVPIWPSAMNTLKISPNFVMNSFKDWKNNPVDAKAISCESNNKNNECQLKITSPLPKEGSYVIEFIPKNKSDPVLYSQKTIKLPVFIAGEVKFNKINVKVIDSYTKMDEFDITATKPHTSKVTLEDNQKLYLKFERPEDSVMYEQVFFVMNAEIDGIKYSVSKMLDHHDGTFSLKLSNSEILSNTQNVGGDFQTFLLIGSSKAKSPIRIKVANIAVMPAIPESRFISDFDEDESKMSSVSTAASSIAFDRQKSEHLKKELFHTFRVPDKRAGSIVAIIFTAICIAPILVLFIGWAYLKVNLSNFPFSVSGIVFQFGLISIFALYVMYWLVWDMFTTLQYLMLISGPTFLAGNSVLRHMVSKRKGVSSVTD